jgi:hypothetical protein
MTAQASAPSLSTSPVAHYDATGDTHPASTASSGQPQEAHALPQMPGSGFWKFGAATWFLAVLLPVVAPMYLCLRPYPATGTLRSRTSIEIAECATNGQCAAIEVPGGDRPAYRRDPHFDGAVVGAAFPVILEGHPAFALYRYASAYGRYSYVAPLDRNPGESIEDVLARNPSAARALLRTPDDAESFDAFLRGGGIFYLPICAYALTFSALALVMLGRMNVRVMLRRVGSIVSTFLRSGCASASAQRLRARFLRRTFAKARTPLPADTPADLSALSIGELQRHVDARYRSAAAELAQLASILTTAMQEKNS